MNQNIKYISDPIFKTIIIKDELIKDLINTREFKRLSRIKHLGVTDFLYPSATHTRYAHSLGVYYLANNILDNLNPNISESTKLAFKSAALLHDIGHGPFSHNFEEVTKVHHEEMTIKILSDSSTEIFKVFKKYGLKIMEETVEMIQGRHKLSWANQLISSEIDVDRIDYLLRDSLFSGAKYIDIDWQWLIRNMVIIDDKLVFKQKALPAVENVIIGRYHMNESIYHNYKNEANAKLIPFFFEKLKELYKKNLLVNNYEPIIKILQDKDLSLEEFYNLDDALLINIIVTSTTEKDKNLKLITNSFLNKIQSNIISKNIDTWKKTKSKNEENKTWKVFTIKEGWNFYKKNTNEEALILTFENEIKKASEVSLILDKLGGQTKLHKTNLIGVEINEKHN